MFFLKWRQFLALVSLGFVIMLFQNFVGVNFPQKKSSIVRPVNQDDVNKIVFKSECSPDKYQEIREPATQGRSQAVIDCSLRLQASDKISKRLILIGSAASNVLLDCRGATIDDQRVNDGKDMIEVRTKMITGKKGEISWDRPEDITVKNCKIHGTARIHGMAKTGEGSYLKESSRSEGHTLRAQQNAPTRISFENMSITGDSRVPLYISPGVTYFSIKNSTIDGHSASVAIYMDTESARNTIENNFIQVNSSKRELIAIDGSAENLIKNNHFSQMSFGGIFLYRNCGEGGTIRHQTPHSNRIEFNKFDGRTLKGKGIFSFTASAQDEDLNSISYPLIFLSSRDGNRNYCGNDKGYPFGSSKSNKDYAENNTIAHNQFLGLPTSYIVDRHPGANNIFDNKSVSEFTENVASTSSTDSSGVDSSSVPVEKSFECQAVGNNLGCSKDFQCPQGTQIEKLKLACNLEFGKVTPEEIKVLPWNRLKVERASDRQSDGVCRVDQIQLSDGYIELLQIVGKSGFNFHCQERDKNGGDCHIAGKVICR